MRTDLWVTLAAVSVVMLLGCEQSTAVESSVNSSAIVGSWHQATQKLSPSGTLEVEMTFNRDGTFRTDSRMYGIYGGEPLTELSAYSRTEGSFTTDGDRLVLSPRRLTTWDRFYGASSKERIDEPYPYTSYFDDAHYDVNGGALTLRYTTYPADAPEPTTMSLKRDE